MSEHYGLTMPVSTIRRMTERHAQSMADQERARMACAVPVKVGILIGAMDDSMIPAVEVAPDAVDKRQGKTLIWKEVRM